MRRRPAALGAKGRPKAPGLEPIAERGAQQPKQPEQPEQPEQPSEPEIPAYVIAAGEGAMWINSANTWDVADTPNAADVLTDRKSVV